MGVEKWGWRDGERWSWVREAVWLASVLPTWELHIFTVCAMTERTLKMNIGGSVNILRDLETTLCSKE